MVRLPASNSDSAPTMPPDRARRMRITATLLLIAMAALFALSHAMEPRHWGWGYALAFAEAAMVGGLADWFAVTALFRHPLGIPIPHTAIIPRSKDRIAETMASFLRANFLTPAVVGRRMREMNVARAASTYLLDRTPGEQSRILAGVSDLFVELLGVLDPQRLGNQVRTGLARQAERIEIAPLLGRMLESFMAENRHRPVIDGLVRWAGLTLEDNEELVREMIRARANAILRWTGLDQRLSDSVLDGLYKLLAEILVDPDHPMRAKAEEALAKLAQDLQHDPALRARVESAKAELLANPAVGEWWMGVWERLRVSLIEVARNPGTALGARLGESLAELGAALRDDPALQMQVNRLARRVIVGLVSRYGDQIVRLVSETVKRWDASTITMRMERAVGRDLQFIRINGTMVGGLVGLALHALTQLI